MCPEISGVRRRGPTQAWAESLAQTPRNEQAPQLLVPQSAAGPEVSSSAA